MGRKFAAKLSYVDNGVQVERDIDERMVYGITYGEGFQGKTPDGMGFVFYGVSNPSVAFKNLAIFVSKEGYWIATNPSPETGAVAKAKHGDDQEQTITRKGYYLSKANKIYLGEGSERFEVEFSQYDSNPNQHRKPSESSGVKTAVKKKESLSQKFEKLLYGEKPIPANS